MRDESDVESWVVERAWALWGIPSIKLNVEGDTGWPDRLFILEKAHALWIEFKRPGETAISPKQDLKKQILEYRDHDHQVHNNREKALEAVREAAAKAGNVRAKKAAPATRNKAKAPKR